MGIKKQSPQKKGRPLQEWNPTLQNWDQRVITKLRNPSPLKNMQANQSPNFSNIPTNAPKRSSILLIPQNSNNGTHKQAKENGLSSQQWIEEELLKHISYISLTNAYKAERLKKKSQTH